MKNKHPKRKKANKMRTPSEISLHIIVVFDSKAWQEKKLATIKRLAKKNKKNGK